jgi:CTP synthase
MPDQEKITDKGGTMRLGAYPCEIEKESLAFKAYKETKISERHRHRYEFNNQYREILTKSGLKLSGLSPDKRLVEIIELPEHPYFIAVQFHPELKSRPTKAHPLFRELVRFALEYKKSTTQKTEEAVKKI